MENTYNCRAELLFRFEPHLGARAAVGFFGELFVRRPTCRTEPVGGCPSPEGLIR